jgi:hypothetical protein
VRCHGWWSLLLTLRMIQIMTPSSAT